MGYGQKKIRKNVCFWRKHEIASPYKQYSLEVSLVNSNRAEAGEKSRAIEKEWVCVCVWVTRCRTVIKFATVNNRWCAACVCVVCWCVSSKLTSLPRQVLNHDFGQLVGGFFCQERSVLKPHRLYSRPCQMWEQYLKWGVKWLYCSVGGGDGGGYGKSIRRQLG